MLSLDQVSEAIPAAILPGTGVSSNPFYLTGEFLNCIKALEKKNGKEETRSSSITSSEKLCLNFLLLEVELAVFPT